MTKDIRICFIGDSYVNGTGDEAALGWAGRLCVSANTRGAQVTYYNLGVRRDTTRDVLGRWENECLRRLPGGCDGRLVVSCGVNDTVRENGAPRVTAAESRDNFRLILAAANKFSLLAVGPPAVADEAQNRRIEALSRAFAGAAHEVGVPYVELYPALRADFAYRDEISKTDGYHPGSAGYARIAQIIEASPQWWFHGR